MMIPVREKAAGMRGRAAYDWLVANGVDPMRVVAWRDADYDPVSATVTLTMFELDTQGKRIWVERRDDGYVTSRRTVPVNVAPPAILVAA